MKRRQRSVSAWRRASFQVLACRHLSRRSCPDEAEVADRASSRPRVYIWQHLSDCLFVGGRTWTLTQLLFGTKAFEPPCIPCFLCLHGSDTRRAILGPEKRRKEVIHKVCGPSRGSRQTEASVYRLSLSTLVPLPLSIIFYGQHLHGRYPKQRLLRQHFRLLNWAYKASPPLHFSLFINWGGGASNLPLRTAWGQLWRRQQTWKSPI